LQAAAGEKLVHRESQSKDKQTLAWNPLSALIFYDRFRYFGKGNSDVSSHCADPVETIPLRNSEEETARIPFQGEFIESSIAHQCQVAGTHQTQVKHNDPLAVSGR
jgi:hypothetical protein